MIRLLGHFPSSNTNTNNHNTSSLSRSHRSPSVQIKLGPRRKRMATLQPARESLCHSIKNAKTQSFETSYIDHRITAISKAGTTSPNNKIKRLNLAQREESPCRQNNLSNLLSGLSSCLGQTPQKTSTSGQRTKREIVRLRHRKAKSHSPIQKLLQLLLADQEPSLIIQEGHVIF